MKTLAQLALALLFTTTAFTAEPVKHVQAAEAAALIAKGGVVIVDVRTADEFAEGHIADARNIDINAADFAAQLAKLDKTKPTLVHCQAGGRSTRALKTFQELGFEHLIHLDDGFGGWADAGKPVVK